MELSVPEEFREICKRIVEERKTEAQWAEEESDDTFQTKSFCGGYDADEHAFCFSYYSEDSTEYWFQLTLNEVHDVLSEEKTALHVRRPD